MDQHKGNDMLEFVIYSLNYKMQLLNKASVIFHANLEQMRCLKKSANICYECQINGERFVLRLTERPPEFAQVIKGEVDWINYLADNGIKVSRAIPSLNGDYTAVIKDEISCFLASCFVMSKGHHVNPDNPHEWNDSLFEKWGQTLGKMHALSKRYVIKDPSTSRPNWNYGPLFSPDLDLGPSEDKILKMWRILISELESLPKDKDSYGIVHNDLHEKNFLLFDSNIIVIDFDSCGFNWFACDIAYLLYHTIYTFDSTRYNTEESMIKKFFSGYNRENTIGVYWMNLIPKFLRFMDIYMYLEKYLFYNAVWNSKTLYIEKMDDLRRQKSRIENEIPCFDVDFNAILEDIL